MVGTIGVSRPPAQTGGDPASGLSRAARPAALFSVVLLIAFLLFTYWGPSPGSAAVDRAAVWWSERVESYLPHRLFDLLGRLGAPRVSVVLAACVATLTFMRRRWTAAVLVIAVLGLLTLIEAVLRVRFEAVPWRDLIDALRHPHGRGLEASTYPSGHVARFTLLAGITATLLPPRWWPPVAVLVLVAGGLMAVQRVLTGTHPGSDGLGGLLLAGWLAAGYAALLPLATRFDRALRRLVASRLSG